MKKRDDDRTLYIGLDESNHGRYPEIIVAVSSLIRTDASTSKMNKRERMGEEELIRFLKNEQRFFFYVKASEWQLTKGEHQLVEAAPSLVNSLISAKKGYANIDSIELLFDGELRLGDSDELFYRIRRMKYIRRIPRISYEAFPKSRKERYDYPKILIAADSLAHLLYSKHSFIDRIGANNRMIELKR